MEGTRTDETTVEDRNGRTIEAGDDVILLFETGSPTLEVVRTSEFNELVVMAGFERVVNGTEVRLA